MNAKRTYMVALAMLVVIGLVMLPGCPRRGNVDWQNGNAFWDNTAGQGGNNGGGNNGGGLVWIGGLNGPPANPNNGGNNGGNNAGNNAVNNAGNQNGGFVVNPPVGQLGNLGNLNGGNGGAANNSSGGRTARQRLLDRMNRNRTARLSNRRTSAGSRARPPIGQRLNWP